MPRAKTSGNPYMVPTTPYSEYAPKYEKLFNLSCTDDGIVMAKWCIHKCIYHSGILHCYAVVYL